MVVLWLGDPGCDETAIVGGTVASLSRLAGVYPVPHGFCALSSVLTGSAGMALPPPLAAHIADAYQRLGDVCAEPEPRVAVRSSAADEDGADASFAGQHETYLNVTSLEAGMDAVRRCWESAHSERAYAYRRLQGLSLDDIRLAVLVQRLVPADVSAVVFSANPITSNHDELVINASWGLGESIVGGTVTPDTYIVRNQDGAITEQRIAEKRRMTVAVSGGTQEVDVPRFVRDQPTLNERQIAAMTDLACGLEQTMGRLVDIECASHGDRLFLLQCRPITALSGGQPAPALIQPDD